MLVDSHAHLNFPDFAENLAKIIADAKAAGVEKIINIGTSLKDSQDTIVLAQKYPSLYASVGIHPNDDPTATVENVDWEKFEKLAGAEKVVAIGECGLDYSRIQYSVSSIEYAQEKVRQKKLFEKQIEIAAKLNLPLSIHLRDAQDDLASEFGNILKELSGAFHCFSGDKNYLDFILEKLPNFYISFAGNITFKNAQPLRDLAKGVPLDRLLVETDCPFLSPEPNRGKTNEPANIKFTASKLAETKELSSEEVGKITTDNAKQLFRL